MKKIKYLMPILVVIASCQQQNKESDTQKTVDQLHNEAMTINETVIKNRLLLDSLLNVKRSNFDPDTLNIKSVIAALALADEKMMDWMHSFDHEFKGSEAEVAKYHHDQTDSLKKVYQRLEQAIDQSKPYLKP